MLVQLLRDAGYATVVAADPLPHRVQAALDLGATEAVTVDQDGTVTGDVPRVDRAFDVSGAPAAVELVIALSAPAGRVVLVGIPDDDRTTFRASVARRKELSLTIARRMRPADLGRAIELAATGRVKLAPLVTASLPLSDVGRAFELLVARDGLKTIVRPG